MTACWRGNVGAVGACLGAWRIGATDLVCICIAGLTWREFKRLRAAMVAGTRSRDRVNVGVILRSTILFIDRLILLFLIAIIKE